jgi:thiol:disulfide interchange protein DsbD
VWPIIPLTVSFFIKRTRNRRQAFREAFWYGLSILLIYLTLGIGITLLFGASALNSLSTSAFFNLLFFALLVLFGISFLGAFDLVLPASWTNRINRQPRTPPAYSASFSWPSRWCSSPFPARPYHRHLTGRSRLPERLGRPSHRMLGFALALAIPFALFALFPHWLKRLPKSGSWLIPSKLFSAL